MELKLQEIGSSQGRPNVLGILVYGNLIGIVQNLSASDAINLRSSFGLVYSR